MRRGAYPVWLFLHAAGAFGSALVTTVSAVYFVTEVGLSPLQLILVGTVMEVTYFLFELPTGVVADVYSRRLSIVIGTILQGAGFALAGSVPSFEVILIGWAIWGFGATFESGALEAWITDELEGRGLTRVFLRGSQIGYAFTFLAIPVSVALATVDLQLSVVAGGLVIVALGVVLAVVMPETKFRPAQRTDAGRWRELGGTAVSGGRLIRRQPVLLTILGVAAVWGAWTEGFDRLWEAHFLRDVGLPDLGTLEPVVWFGIINAATLVLAFALNGLMARRVKHDRPIDAVRVLLVLNVILIASVLAFALATSFALAVAAFLVARPVRGLVSPLFTAWLNENIGDTRVRATVNSIVGQSDAVGQFTLGPTIGVVGNAFGIRAALASGTLALVPALGLYAHALRHGGREPVLADAAADADALASAGDASR